MRQLLRVSRRSPALGLVVIALSAAALSLAGTAVAGGGNSENAQRCQHGGWQTLLRTDGSAFRNQGECVSYAARGGLLQEMASLTVTFEKVNCLNLRVIATGFGLRPGTFVSIYLDGVFAVGDYGPVEADGTIATNGGWFWGGIAGAVVTAAGTTAAGETITSPPVVAPPFC